MRRPIPGQVTWVLLLAVVFILAMHATASATVTFSWSAPDPTGLNQTGNASFEITGSQVKITLTDTTSALTGTGATDFSTQAQVLTGLTWDITTSGVALSTSGGSASVALGSAVVNSTAFALTTNIGPEWAYKTIAIAGFGSNLLTTVGTVGGVNAGVGPGTRFDTTQNYTGPAGGAVGGADWGLVGPNVVLVPPVGSLCVNPDGLCDPYIKNSAEFILAFTGPFSEGEITNVQPIFGSQGHALVPEPSTLFLVGAGMASAGLWGRKKLWGKKG